MMPNRQAFLSLTIIDNNTMLARPILPITPLFFLALSLYQHWLHVCELGAAMLDLAHALTIACVPFWHVACILGKSLAFGLGVRL
jgi:hypothetical protein